MARFTHHRTRHFHCHASVATPSLRREGRPIPCVVTVVWQWQPLPLPLPRVQTGSHPPRPPPPPPPSQMIKRLVGQPSSWPLWIHWSSSLGSLLLPPSCWWRAGRGGAWVWRWGALAHEGHGAPGGREQSWRQWSCVVVAVAITVLDPHGCCGPVGPDPPWLPSPQTPALLRLHAIALPPTRLLIVECSHHQSLAMSIFLPLYPPHTSLSNPPLLFLSPKMKSKK